MKMQAIETVVSGLNGLEGIMVERKATRRGFLRIIKKLALIAAMVGMALTATQSFASASRQASGLDLLRAWAFQQIPVQSLPGDGWQPYTYGNLTFMVPDGWNLGEVNQNGETGVLITSPDQSIGFAALQLPINQRVNARDAALWQIAQITGLNSFETIYDDYAETSSEGDAFIALRQDQALIAVHCQALATRGGTTLNFWIQFGQADVFDAATEQIFLPFMGQFFVSPSQGGAVSTGATSGGSDGGYSGNSGGSDGGYSGGNSGVYTGGSGDAGDVINPNDCVYARDSGSAGDVINPDQCTVYTDDSGNDYTVTNAGDQVYSDGTVYDGSYTTADSGGGYDSSYDSGYSSYDDSGE